MRYVCLQLIILTVLALVPASGAARAEEAPVFSHSGEYITINARNADIRSLFSMLAQSLDINLLMSSAVRGTITLSLKDVHYRLAIDLIARTNGFAVRESGAVFYVDVPYSATHLTAVPATRVYRLQYAPAEAVAGLLRTIYGDRISVAADVTNNSVIVSGPPALLEELGLQLAPPAN